MPMSTNNRVYAILTAGFFVFASVGVFTPSVHAISIDSIFNRVLSSMPSPEDTMTNSFRRICTNERFQSFLSTCQNLPPEEDTSNNDGGEDEGSQEPQDPEVVDAPVADHLVINEVLSNPTNGVEWVELYNPTSEMINLKDWKLLDNTSERVIINRDYTLQAGAFVIVAASESGSISFGGAAINLIGFSGSIGNGLANAGDAVHLVNPTGQEIDAMSYGSNTDVFTPSAPTPDRGDSVGRVPNGADSDTAFEWEEFNTPTPGF